MWAALRPTVGLVVVTALVSMCCLQAAAAWVFSAPPAPDLSRDEVSLLIQKLASEESWLRFYAAEELGRRGPNAAAAVQPLLECLRKHDSAAAVAALGNIGASSEEVLNDIRNACVHPLASVRISAVAALIKLQPSLRDKSIAYYIARLDSPDGLARGHALSTLAEIGPLAHEAVPRLVELISDVASDFEASVMTTFDQHARQIRESCDVWSILRTLERVAPGRGGEAVPVLRKLLRRGELSVRGAAVRTLAIVAPKSYHTLPAICDSLRDSEEYIRVKAATALSTLGPLAYPAVPHLQRALRDSKSEVRRCAACALGAIGTDAGDAVPDLLTAFHDRQFFVGDAAIEAIPKIRLLTPEDLGTVLDLVRTQRYSRSLVELLKAQGPATTVAHWETIAPLLGKYGHSPPTDLEMMVAGFAACDDNLVDLLLRDLAVEDDVRRAIAVRLLGSVNKSRADEAASALIAACRSGHIRGITASVARLVGASPLAFQRLLREFDAEDELRDVATEAIGLAGEVAVPVLIAKLAQPSFEVRIRASQALSHSGAAARSAFPALIEMLNDDETAIREAAFHALANYASASHELVPQLIRALYGVDIRARESVVQLLGNFGANAAPAVPDLVSLLSNSSVDIRASAVDALIQIAPDSAAAMSAIVDLLDDEDSIVREHVYHGLNNVDDPAVVRSLIDELAHSDEARRYRATTALSAMAEWHPDVAQPLIHALDMGAPAARAAAASALGGSTQWSAPGVLPALVWALFDEDDAVRTCAYHALRRLIRVIYGAPDEDDVPWWN